MTKIITEHVYPPIPTRTMDWSAATDNYEPGAPLEYGATEKEAIDNLLNEHCLARNADGHTVEECKLCFAPWSERHTCRAELP